MHLNKRTTAAVLLSLAVAASWAHGDKRHPTKAVDLARAEQKEFGIAGDPKKAKRTIRITMTDMMRFTPDRIEVNRGDTIRFIVANKGKMLHEIVIGTAADLKEHAALMKKFPDMEHDEPHMAHAPAGKSEQLVWHFNRAGEFNFACLMPGHFEAGMIGKIVVSEK